MNKYGLKAQEHWKRWLPTRYSQLENPDRYFSTLGDEIQTRIEELSLASAGDDPPKESYLDKLGRLNMTRLNAESQALQELALLEPEAAETQTSTARE
ncbi:MAG TPA: hypothetical protein VF331_11260 [Polyangiales bacterium]